MGTEGCGREEGCRAAGGGGNLGGNGTADDALRDDDGEAMQQWQWLRQPRRERRCRGRKKRQRRRWQGWLAAPRRNVAARAAVRALLGGGGEDRWATASDGEDGGGYEVCPLRRRKAMAERAIKFATDQPQSSASPPRIPGRLRFDELVEKSKGQSKGPV